MCIQGFHCITLKRLDTSSSNAPPHPGRVQIPHLLGMGDGQMLMGCPRRCWISKTVLWSYFVTLSEKTCMSRKSEDLKWIARQKQWEGYQGFLFIYLFILNSFCCPWLSSIYYARRWGKVSLVHSSLDQKFQLGALTSSLHCILGQDTRIMRGICNCQETLGKLLEVIFDGPESCWGWVAILPATLVHSKRDKSGDLCQVCHSNNWPGFKSMPP